MDVVVVFFLLIPFFSFSLSAFALVVVVLLSESTRDVSSATFVRFFSPPQLRIYYTCLRYASTSFPLSARPSQTGVVFCSPKE